jgi:hypothetical protein
MHKPLTTVDAGVEQVSFEALKHLVVSASRLMPKGEVLELADALHDALRERRASGERLDARS